MRIFEMNPAKLIELNCLLSDNPLDAYRSEARTYLSRVPKTGCFAIELYDLSPLINLSFMQGERKLTKNAKTVIVDISVFKDNVVQLFLVFEIKEKTYKFNDFNAVERLEIYNAFVKAHRNKGYKRMRFKGFTIKQVGYDLFRCVYVDSDKKKWECTDTFKKVGMWVWNMADNHDIGREVNHRMCEVYNRVFFDD